MARWKCVVSYDGSCYGGWQKQLNTSSIQEEIEFALKKMHGSDVTAVASGRTDAYVHAIGQVFHFDSELEIDDNHWKTALNALLPKDIRIQTVSEVHKDFHARFCATQKRYDYLVTNEIHNPFFQKYMGKEYRELDVAFMQECATVFIGTHDFTTFSSNKIDARKSRIKTITRLDIQKEEHAIRLIFEGNGFLRYMVRMLAQTLIEAGKHKLTKAEIQYMLECKDKHLSRYKAAAEGLYLVKVLYEEEF